ncbi:hypothetical protein CWT12_05985 [Actinomyces sp. 432]|uniref:hypothetical protein n=1 Tax=unclassified Actinomyces TaxID=2609248 RepID=UPI001373FF42|nr:MULTISPECIES: hypothetical protein [unclassified Actinomyces]MBW3068434.1 hypothetical protein [Actinomyces sp. 594]QHO90963.1 hypothetical protein CWT12_05985 [Actinomyces sp. 432]
MTASSTQGTPPGSMTRTVPARVVLAHLLHEPVQPALGPLTRQELHLLHYPDIDEQVLTEVAGQMVPADMIRTPFQRARALKPIVSAGRTVAGRTALWVHTGGCPPSRVELATGTGPGTVVKLAGLNCLPLTRVVVDLARTAPPGIAVSAVLRARRAGVTRAELEPDLLACRGGRMRGLRRARRLIDDLYAPRSQAPTCASS